MASPFPSPSSSFIPPTIPVTHEYAVMNNNGMRRKSALNGVSTPADPTMGSGAINTAVNAQLQHFHHHNNGVNNKRNSSSSLYPIPPSHTTTWMKRSSAPPQSAREADMELDSALFSGASATKSNANTIDTNGSIFAVNAGFQANCDDVASPPAVITIPDFPPSPTTPSSINRTNGDICGPSSSTTLSSGKLQPTDIMTTTGSTANAANGATPLSLDLTSSPSLTSSRPAPPSPALSRRASAAPSAISTPSRLSRPPSTAFDSGGGTAAIFSPAAKRLSSNSRRDVSPSPSPRVSMTNSGVLNIGGFGGTRTGSKSVDEDNNGRNKGAPAFISLNDNDNAGSMTDIATPSTAVPLTAKAGTEEDGVDCVQRDKVFIKIRDYAFSKDDERHRGLGPFVPKANKIARLNRKLAPGGEAKVKKEKKKKRTVNGWSDSEGSQDGEVSGDESSEMGSSEDEAVEEDEEDMKESGYDGGWEIGDAGPRWGGFRFGRLSWIQGSGVAALNGTTNGQNGFPSQMDLQRNFLGDDEDIDGNDDDEVFVDALEHDGNDQNYPQDDADQEGDGDEEPLYPGLYRAMYAFEPEDDAEMGLDEEQIVRVVGRGGGAGWAVVIDTREGREGGHALVPESYLEVVKLDGWDAESEMDIEVESDRDEAEESV
ncbi:hypothetical protein AMATHDRAFT_50400 [Amanita thiersii Skay4041]|uniref:SH3 domain-containing protein n=1 Tax=Amanita thiersii Skay4041 TaxID=703135 RepID=A0A2A9NGE5_9AGAR|nr:hypothetical protein AMATHDRAFT_50400 [Amanita thiersii Skay4041]